MAMTILNEKFIRFSEETKKAEVIAEIYVDTSDELPERNSLNDRYLHQGSMAYVIRENIFSVLDSDGKWLSVDSGITS
ncbi:MAG: hypothetical protein K2J39_11665 [Ruminococcus sp.]|nr:hypothetical protein [Ruminococcus sp.]